MFYLFAKFCDALYKLIPTSMDFVIGTFFKPSSSCYILIFELVYLGDTNTN
jgi:hypothetical protein